MAQQSFENLASIGGHKFPARPSRILCASSISPLSCTGTNCSQSIQNGRNLFIDVAKCFVCPTPSMTTGPSYVAALSNVQANLFSDLLIHHMGSGPNQFRTAPLWGLGQRLFFLHDGRTSDLLKAIENHASPGSEANTAIRIFNGLTESQQQDLLNFLRSL
jgi:CxxC motif-containing protein (DUF1111 family)